MTDMKDREKPIDLTSLETSYEIRGELRSADGARRFAARHRADGADVIITVATAPRKGASNSLGLFASDARLLAGVAHPLVPRVLDAEWVGPNEFAVITERIEGPGLRDVLAREEMSTARIADVLQDVHAAIGWAREIGVVHRTVTADSLRFEERTGRPYVTFVPGEIAVNALPDACSDARTVGMLARAMLAGAVDSVATTEELIAARSDLAERVAAEAETMCRCEAGGEVPDVSAFLASIAMNDALKAGESERARVQSELAEADRAERERWQAREREIEQREAEHRRRLEEERKEFERQLAAERAAFEKRMLQEQRRLEAERSRLELRRGAGGAAAAAGAAGVAAAATNASAQLPASPPPPPDAADEVRVKTVRDDVPDEPVDDGPAVVPAPGRGRPAWAVPALTVALVVLVMALVSGLGRRSSGSEGGIVVAPPVQQETAGAVDPDTYWPETYRATPPAPEQPNPLYTVPPYTPPPAYTPPSYDVPPYSPPAPVTSEPRRPIAEPVWTPARDPAPTEPVSPAQPVEEPARPAPATLPATAPRDTQQPQPAPTLTPRLTPSLPPGIEIRPIPVPVVPVIPPPPPDTARP